MDKYTFGDSEAAKSLTEIVEKFEEKNEKNVMQSIQRRLGRLRELLKDLKNLENQEFKKYLAQLTLKDFQEETHRRTEDWPENMRTHFLNVANTAYKRFIKNEL